MRDCSDTLLRWSAGQQDTVTLSDYTQIEKFKNFIWLTKLSILSFQKKFPGARLVLLYNGGQFDFFNEIYATTDPMVDQVEIINQNDSVATGQFENPYSFWPAGVWWKWIPFRLDITKHEIAVDTDIICIDSPSSWYDWLDDGPPVLVAPERYKKTRVNTCGDFAGHPLLKGRTPANCGIVGQRQGHNYAERFFDVTEQVRLGYTQNSFFITEQGAINLWIYLLEMEGVSHRKLDFAKNAWIRDFVYFMRQGVRVETVHAVSWHKEIAKQIGEYLEKRVCDPDYSADKFILDILRTSTEFSPVGKVILDQQLRDWAPDTEFYILRPQSP